MRSAASVLRRADAWGKHLFHHYDGGHVVHVHLGLYGSFTEAPLPLDEPVGQVRMRMIGTEYGTDLRGPTVCEIIDAGAVDDVVARLGPDPLRPDADPASAWKRITKSRRTIGGLLMDQTIIAGVGNVYRSELLYRHHIDPFRPGTQIDADEFAAMWADLVALMKVGVRRGKIVVVRPRTRPRRTVIPARPAADLCLPPRRRRLPGVRHNRADGRTGGAQRVLVPHLPDLTRGQRRRR